ncbi:MAG: hypothetical protein GXP45_01220, partial [bacterium]|nr:hypothetical protein [bacterium]
LMKKVLLSILALAGMSFFAFQGVQAQESTDVYLHINEGNITIGAT